MEETVFPGHSVVDPLPTPSMSADNISPDVHNLNQNFSGKLVVDEHIRPVGLGDPLAI